MSDIDIDIGKSKGEGSDGDDSGSSTGGGGRRGHIFIKMRYGTRQFDPETECRNCGARAVGVLDIPSESFPDDQVPEPRPLCSSHRDEVKSKNPELFEASEFRRFVDA